MTRTLFVMFALAAAGRADSLSDLRDLAARSAERKLTALSSMACTETVVATKVNQKNKTEEQSRRTFDYVALVDFEDGELTVTESRIEQGKPRVKAKLETDEPLLASTGFATMAAILHPYYRNSFVFSDLGLVEESGRSRRRLAFEFRPGQRSPGVLRSGAREYPLAWSGEALVDEKTGEVSSIHATLGAQLKEIGLESLEVDVRYAPVPGRETDEWLPAEAVIDLKTLHQHWHNVHTFADYRRFDVNATEKREGPK